MIHSSLGWRLNNKLLSCGIAVTIIPDSNETTLQRYGGGLHDYEKTNKLLSTVKYKKDQYNKRVGAVKCGMV